MTKNWPLLFIIIPVIEIYLLITVGGHIGALWTVLLVVTTAVIGVNLLRYQGFSTLRRAQQNMAKGAMPAMEMMEGLFLAVGGALLITPGFLTDSIGFLCLLPFTRRAIIRYIMANATLKMSGFSAQQGYYSPQQNNQSSHSQSRQDSETSSQADNKSGRTIEGEYTRKDD